MRDVNPLLFHDLREQTEVNAAFGKLFELLEPICMAGPYLDEAHIRLEEARCWANRAAQLKNLADEAAAMVSEQAEAKRE